MDLSHYAISKDVRSSLREIPVNDLRTFFESIRQVEYKKLPSVSKDDLTGHQARVNMITVIESILIAVSSPRK